MQRAWVYAARVIDPLINKGEADRASRIARWFVRVFPHQPQGWILLMRTYSNFGRPQEAEEVGREGLVINPADAELKAAIAAEMFAQGRLEEARSWLAAMQHEHPDSAYPYIWLAVIARHQDRFDDARRFVHEGRERVDDAVPFSVKVDQLTHLGLNLTQIPGERQSAIAMLKEATEEPGSHDPRPHMALSVLLKEDRQHEALEHLEFARAHWRGNAESFERELKHDEQSLPPDER